MTKTAMSILIATLLLAVSPLAAQLPAPPAEVPAHNELRALRDGFTEAFNKKDIDGMLAWMHPDIVITFQNGDVCRGHTGVRAFHKQMSEGDDRKVTAMTNEFAVDELSIIHGGDTAIAFGNMHSTFDLARGMQFDLDSRWTATLVKEDDRWQIASLHASTNMFDNGVLNLMLKWNGIKVGAAALIVGLIIGLLLARGFCRKRPAAA